MRCEIRRLAKPYAWVTNGGVEWAVPGTVEVKGRFLLEFGNLGLGVRLVGRDPEVYIWFGKLGLSEMLPSFTTDEYQMINKIYRAFVIILLCTE